ncbi:MAG: hypothetical protein ACOC83_05015 [Gemmatimonadota bacterium]
MKRLSGVWLFALGLAAAAALLAIPSAAHAYGGPGSIVSGIGALVAVAVAIAAAVVGFFWFPLKRLIQKLRGEQQEEDETEVAEASS